MQPNQINVILTYAICIPVFLINGFIQKQYHPIFFWACMTLAIISLVLMVLKMNGISR